jgi:hypothetical protein
MGLPPASRALLPPLPLRPASDMYVAKIQWCAGLCRSWRGWRVQAGKRLQRSGFQAGAHVAGRVPWGAALRASAVGVRVENTCGTVGES